MSEILGKLKSMFAGLEECFRGDKYLMGRFSLADVAYTGNFVRLRELAQKGAVTLTDYPNVVS